MFINYRILDQNSNKKASNKEALRPFKIPHKTSYIDFSKLSLTLTPRYQDDAKNNQQRNCSELKTETFEKADPKQKQGKQGAHIKSNFLIEKRPSSNLERSHNAHLNHNIYSFTPTISYSSRKIVDDLVEKSKGSARESKISDSETKNKRRVTSPNKCNHDDYSKIIEFRKSQSQNDFYKPITPLKKPSRYSNVKDEKKLSNLSNSSSLDLSTLPKNPVIQALRQSKMISSSIESKDYKAIRDLLIQNNNLKFKSGRNEDSKHVNKENTSLYSGSGSIERIITKIVSPNSLMDVFHGKNFKRKSPDKSDRDIKSNIKLSLISKSKYPEKDTTNPKLLDLLVQRKKRFDTYVSKLEEEKVLPLDVRNKRLFYIKGPPSDKKPYKPIASNQGTDYSIPIEDDNDQDKREQIAKKYTNHEDSNNLYEIQEIEENERLDKHDRSDVRFKPNYNYEKDSSRRDFSNISNNSDVVDRSQGVQLSSDIEVNEVKDL